MAAVYHECVVQSSRRYISGGESGQATQHELGFAGRFAESTLCSYSTRISRPDLRGDPRRAQSLPRERDPRRSHLHRARAPQDRDSHGRDLRAQAPGPHAATQREAFFLFVWEGLQNACYIQDGQLKASTNGLVRL